MGVVDDEDDNVELSSSTLSSVNALIRASWISMYRLFFRCRSSGVSSPMKAS